MTDTRQHHPTAGGLAVNARRLETFMRWSLYVLLGFELLFALPLVARSGEPSTATLVLVVGMTVQVAVNIAVCRWAIGIARTGRSIRPTGRARWLLALAAVFTLGMIILTPFTMGADPVTQVQAIGVVVSPLCAVTPALRWLPTLIAALVAMVVEGLVVVSGASGSFGLPYALGISVALCIYTGAIVLSFWLSGWMLRVFWELDEARGRQAALAIAEERLRIARDLHDVFGRTLATVAVKSELAAELARRGRTEAAAEEIGAVRAIADEAGREVRQVVNGYRSPTLVTELAGAQSLLSSAGIRCVVQGAPPPELPPVALEALGWALRELVTNVIRHSTATECSIVVTATDPVRLLVSNDGAARGRAEAGNGLRGIAERVAPFGGTARHHNENGRFEVDVAIPLPPQPALTGARA